MFKQDTKNYGEIMASHHEDSSKNEKTFAEDMRYRYHEDIIELRENRLGTVIDSVPYIQHTKDIEELTNLIALSDLEIAEKNLDEFYEYTNMLEQSSYAYFKEDIDSHWIRGFYVIEGMQGRWNGKGYVSDIQDLDNIEEFIENLQTFDSVSATYYKKGILEWTHTHHDGGNSYLARHIYNYTIPKIKEILEEKENKYGLNEQSQMVFNKAYSRLKKIELIELLYEYIY